MAGGGHFPSQFSACLCISLHPVGLPHALFSFFQLPPLLQTPLPSHSFLLFLWMQGTRHFCLWTLGPRGHASFAFWSMILIGPQTVLTLSVTTRARACTQPLHDFLSLTHTHSQKDDIDHAPGLFQMPRFIFGAHMCRLLGSERVFHHRGVPSLFRRGVTSPRHWPCVPVLSTAHEGRAPENIC